MYWKYNFKKIISFYKIDRNWYSKTSMIWWYYGILVSASTIDLLLYMYECTKMKISLLVSLHYLNVFPHTKWIISMGVFLWNSLWDGLVDLEFCPQLRWFFVLCLISYDITSTLSLEESLLVFLSSNWGRDDWETERRFILIDFIERIFMFILLCCFWERFSALFVSTGILLSYPKL